MPKSKLLWPPVRLTPVLSSQAPGSLQVIHTFRSLAAYSIDPLSAWIALHLPAPPGIWLVLWAILLWPSSGAFLTPALETMHDIAICDLLSLIHGGILHVFFLFFCFDFCCCYCLFWGLFWDRVSVWPRIHWVAQAGLKFIAIVLLGSPKGLDLQLLIILPG